MMLNRRPRGRGLSDRLGEQLVEHRKVPEFGIHFCFEQSNFIPLEFLHMTLNHLLRLFKLSLSAWFPSAISQLASLDSAEWLRGRFSDDGLSLERPSFGGPFGFRSAQVVCDTVGILGNLVTKNNSFLCLSCFPTMELKRRGLPEWLQGWSVVSGWYGYFFFYTCLNVVLTK